jgi:hypothetical protein
MCNFGELSVHMGNAFVQVQKLDPNAIQLRMDETNRLNYKMVKARPQDPVAAALKAELDSFKEQLPLLQEV